MPAGGGGAWSCTEQNRVFSPVADELTPLLRKRLAPDERHQLCDMLAKVANAYGEASELQVDAIDRLRRRPAMPDVERSQIERPF